MVEHRDRYEKMGGKRDGYRPSFLMVCGGMGAGGKERQIVELLKGLNSRHRFRTILAIGHVHGSRESEAAEWADKVLLVRRFNNSDPITPLIDLVLLAKKEKINLVHSWGGGIWDLYGLAVARICRVPFIHGGIRSAPSSLDLANKISRYAASHAEIIVANSWSGLDAFGFRNSSKTRVIYNGIDMKRFDKIDTMLSGRPTICMVANFSDKKDHATPVYALADILKCFPEARLVLVGHDSGTLADTKSLVYELGLSHAVEFVTGTLNPEGLIGRSNVCILSSPTEGLSNSILEYMGLRKPVIATDNPGNREIIDHGVTGFLVPFRSPESLAEHVIKLLKNPDLAYSMGEAGYKKLTEKFSLERMVTSFEDLYSGLLD